MDVNPNHPSDNNYDDLTTIKGIGQTRQQWLRDTFNVRTFRDLAALAADTIEARLKAEKQIPSRSHIERWLSEAKQFAENPALVPVTKVKLSTKEDDWKPFASFVVEFQDSASQLEVRTRVHYIEGDQTRTWTGVDQQELCQWITQQLGDKAKPPVVQVAAEKVTPFIESPAAAVLTPVVADQMPVPAAQRSPTELPAASMSQPTPIQNGEAGFSDQLQRMLAKVARASRPGVQVRTTPAPIARQAAAAPPETTASNNPLVLSGSPNQSSTEYNDKLQQLIAKARRLSSGRS